MKEKNGDDPFAVDLIWENNTEKESISTSDATINTDLSSTPLQ